ncbi:5'-3' exoribonuclease 2 [Echinococcus granulosus]|uniref:5'-3' exoribonuclease 2 n=1 Tax=Echinococcus granulosus TaxID=6210 RepID=W6UME3_ECHGR|nr:5'-3' exoribonuclease 2 [Echinococcus granulosus]EUB59297.1 5'-3' exoribonuclease 2 [Echinococcus granulosus]
MGVPAFFRWLSQKYPSIVAHCVEKRGRVIDEEGHREPVDILGPNPNGEEFDNLYLDMNGIIHPCTHPENKPPPKTEAEMFVAIFEHIDRIFAIVRPRRLLYMAIDGVAPRAKMNQQRSRRFRAAKESHDKELTVERLRSELMAKGARLPPPKSAAEHFDSNCITPGTPFMERLALVLQYYVYERLNSHPAWREIQVILSDSNAPGEGEHKIMDFIRRQRQAPTHDPNTRHCLCGADADLIMLGLATHEPHFTIIREEFKPNQPKPCDLCGQYGHDMEDCVGAPSENFDRPPPPPGTDMEFIFIKLAVLRQYLEMELRMPNLPFQWDLERAIDDWVFMCFFVGNDFLPHLPSLEIREGAIDRLIDLYKLAVCDVGGWLTDSGRVNLDRVQLIMTELGKVEDEIFKSRREEELALRERRKRQKLGDGGRHYWDAPLSGILTPAPIGEKPRFGSVNAKEMHDARRHRQPNVKWVEQCLQNQEAAVSLRAMLKSSTSPPPSRKTKAPPSNDEGEDEGGPSLPKRPRRGRLGGVDASVIKTRQVEEGADGETLDEDERADRCDEVRLWEEGWRTRYYQSKFGVDPADAPEFCIKVAHEYVIGLCWVLAYYYQGCASWDWYYPYHYAPFASDFVNVVSVETGFAKKRTKPFRPLEQLMGVFPAASRSHVPPAWQDLMTDPDSPIIDFYPTDFKVDLNGKRYLWMGVALLPFVDEVRLLKALDERRGQLTDEERHRNLRRPGLYFVHADTPIGQTITALYDPSSVELAAERVKKLKGSSGGEYDGIAPPEATLINAALTQGIAGHVWPDRKGVCLPGRRMPSGVPGLLPDIPAVQQHAVSAYFENPPYPFGYVFPTRLLDSVKMPPRCQLLPPTSRGRGRGRGGRSINGGNPRFDGFSNGNNNAWGGGTSWRADQTPAERMIHRALPDCNEFYAPRQRLNPTQRFHPYDRQQQHQRAPTYPPAYPPPSLMGPFANPYTAYPHPDDELDWNRRGGSRSGRPPSYRGGSGVWWKRLDLELRPKVAQAPSSICRLGLRMRSDSKKYRQEYPD